MIITNNERERNAPFLNSNEMKYNLKVGAHYWVKLFTDDEYEPALLTDELDFRFLNGVHVPYKDVSHYFLMEKPDVFGGMKGKQVHAMSNTTDLDEGIMITFTDGSIVTCAWNKGEGYMTWSWGTDL